MPSADRQCLVPVRVTRVADLCPNMLVILAIRQSALMITQSAPCRKRAVAGKRCFGPEAMHSHDVCKQVLTYLRWKTSALKNSGMPAMALMVEQVRIGVVCTRP